MTQPTLELLIAPRHIPDRGPSSIGPDDAEERLSALYAGPDVDRPWVRANMISTLDGAATGKDERSGSINGPADLRVFTTLRALADVVLVGAGTVRAEGYRAPRTPPGLVAGRRRRGQPDHPQLAVVSRRGQLPPDVLTDRRPPLVFTTEHAPGLPRLRRLLPADNLHVHDPGVDLRRVLAELESRGLRGVLTEGGPHLLGSLLEADLLDELCLTTSPLLVGGPAPRVVDGVDWFPTAIEARPLLLMHSDGVLLGRWPLTRH